MKLYSKFLNELDGEGNDLGGAEVVEEQETFDDGMDSALDGLNDEIEEPEEEANKDSEEESPEGEQQQELTDEEFRAQLIADGKEKTAQKFDKLTTSNNELKAKVDELTVKAQNFENLSNEIFDRAKIHPDNLPYLLDFFEDFERGQLRPSSENVFKKIVSEASARFGVNFNDVDPFANHPDIKQAIDDLRIDEAQAREMVSLREQQASVNSRNAQTASREEQQNQIEGTINTATSEIKQLQTNYAANDPDWAAKEKIIVESLQSRLKDIDPSMWVSTFKGIYEDVSAALKYQTERDKKTRDTNTLNTGQSLSENKPNLTEDNFVDMFFSEAQ